MPGKDEEVRSPTGNTILPHHTQGAHPPPPGMLFSPLAPGLFPPGSGQHQLLNPVNNPALLLARYRHNMLLDALWGSAAAAAAAGGVPGMPHPHAHTPPLPGVGAGAGSGPGAAVRPVAPAVSMSPPSRQQPPAAAAPAVGLPAPEQDSPIDLSKKTDPDTPVSVCETTHVY
jgi:hypothetical protein